MRISSGSIGFQAGAQARAIVIAFMTQSALDQFRSSNGWRAGIDGSVALIDIGGGKTIDTQNVRDPIVGFIFGSSGLMANLTLEGTRFTRINKE
jgi:lipid-binding SYLF domain-containing protein